MKRIKTNFRGLRALVLHSDCSSAGRLIEILERLGLIVVRADPGAVCRAHLPPCDIVLFDADDEIKPGLLESFSETHPMIALIGNEAPSHLARVVRSQCNSHILKPIRSTGVYSALLLAINGQDRQRQKDREIAAFRQRLAGRRVVMKAVLKQMQLCGIDEDAAYELLRRRAMERRVPIEVAAQEMLGSATSEQLPPPIRRPRKA